MPKLADRCQETTTTTGTGTFALNGAVTGYVTFGNSFSNGDIVWYVCDSGAGDWEIGYGTYSSSTLTRTVFQSSNANALVPFGVGTKRVFCTAPYTYLLPDQTGNSGKILTTDGTTSSWTTIASAGGVTSVSVASANGFAGTSSGGSTPALTLSTSISGILKGNGTAISAAVAGTDYAAANASFTLGSTSVSLGGTTTTVAGLTLTNPTINGFTGDTSVVNIGSGQFYKDTSGNVGIGTSSPSTKLDVAGNVNITGAAATTTGITIGGSTTARGQLYISNTGGTAAFGVESSTGGSIISGSAAYSTFIGSNSSTPLSFATNSTERMRLDSSGNLGLGVTPSGWSLGTALQLGGGASVLGYANYTYLSSNAYYSSGWKYIGSGNATYYQQNAGIHAWSTAPSGTAGNAISFTQAMTLDASGNLGIGTSSIENFGSTSRAVKVASTASGGYGSFLANSGTYTFEVLVNQDSGVSSIGMRSNHNLSFVTNDTVRATIDTSGNLLVGTTNTDPAGNNVTGAAIKSGAACSIQNGSSTALALGSSANNTYLQVFRNAGTLAGYISVPTANTTTYNSVSDQRLKENIIDAPSALSSVNAIKVRSFDWKSDGLHVDYGWIAQELLEVAPEAVSASDDPDQMMGVDFGRLTPRLVKAIQELSAELNELKAKVNA